MCAGPGFVPGRRRRTEGLSRTGDGTLGSAVSSVMGEVAAASVRTRGWQLAGKREAGARLGLGGGGGGGERPGSRLRVLTGEKE